jgi:hypothetical protein
MLSQFQSSYSRVETSLQKLIDSIAAYNPSVSAAEALLAADAKVSQDLEDLVVHQRNALHLAELRKTSASLDETIKATIRLLAETRKDIQGIAPVAIAETPTRAALNGADLKTRDTTPTSLQVNDVLSYAKFISKTSVPPTYRAPSQPSSESNNNQPSTSATTNNTNNQTPALSTAAAAAPPTTNGLTTPTTAQDDNPPPPPRTTTTAALAALPASTTSFLDPTATTLPFQPWPSQEIIASGALASLQRMVEAGEDPGAVRSKEQIAEEERRREEEEERERIRREEGERIRREGFEDGHGGGGGGGGGMVAFNPDDL